MCDGRRGGLIISLVFFAARTTEYKQDRRGKNPRLFYFHFIDFKMKNTGKR